MERKIKFKAKRLNNGEWIEGDLLHQGSGVFICNLDENGMLIDTEVDPSTVCQFTGLRDSNEVDIFKGDILVFSNKYKNVRYSIEWLDYRYVLKRQDRRTKTVDIQKSRIEKELCIVGNKFDRKEDEE